MPKDCLSRGQASQQVASEARGPGESERRKGPLQWSQSRAAATGELHPSSTFGSLFSRFGQAPVFSFAQSVNNRQLSPGRNSVLSASSTDCCRKNDTTPSSGQTCKLLQISPSLLHSHSWLEKLSVFPWRWEAFPPCGFS